MNNLGTVISFTMRNKLRNKSFLITTLVMVILVVVAGNVPYLIEKLGGEEKVKIVGYVEGQSPEIIAGLQGYFGQQANAKMLLASQGADEDELKRQIADGEIAGYLTLEADDAAGFPIAVYHSKDAFGSSVSQALTAALQAVKTDMVVKDAGLSEEQMQKLLMPVQLSTQKISLTDENGKTESELGTAIGLTYVVVILLFMAVMISGQLIATEITSEKSSRVMEIIVTSVSPLVQMFGKVIGTFIVAILQIAVIVGAMVVSLNLPHNADALQNFGIRLDTIEPAMLVVSVVYFLIGFFLYAVLFAAVGSIVSRTEDLGQAVMPITILTLIGFYIAMFGLSTPESTLVVVCSYIPFFSPFLMVLRVGLSEPGWWEVWVSLGIMLVTTLLLGWLSAKIYRTGVLMYGKRPSVKELIKAMRMYKV
jgi:ABC-2 type transport system permease protein